MTDAIDLAQSAEATANSPAQSASPNPLMAPEFAILRDAGLPLSPHSLPNLKLGSDGVIINLTTSDSANSTEYQSAIAHLQALGCAVVIDRESSESFVHIQITVPESLFPTEIITMLEAKHRAEEIRSRMMERARKAALETFLPEWGC